MNGVDTAAARGRLAKIDALLRPKLMAPSDASTLLLVEILLAAWEELHREMAPCGCAERCGDDGDTDGPGVCKGLPLPPKPPLVEIVLVPR
jgi:hypothetical protein